MTKIYVLLVLDPDVGLAVRPVGVLGVDGEGHYTSFVPYRAGADVWRDRINTTTVPIHRAVEHWAEEADGVSVELIPVDPADLPRAADLPSAVEAVLDELLTPAAARADRLPATPGGTPTA